MVSFGARPVGRLVPPWIIEIEIEPGTPVRGTVDLVAYPAQERRVVAEVRLTRTPKRLGVTVFQSFLNHLRRVHERVLGIAEEPFDPHLRGTRVPLSGI